jgi:hypothetical protein
VEHYQADAVRRVALVAGAYLAGDFTVRRRRTWFRRRLQPVVEVEVRGERWTLRRAALTR